ncbi:MAG: DMT family transporter [Cyanobacteria bacterium J06642_3]
MNKPSPWRITIMLLIGITGVSLAAIWIRLAIDAVVVDNKVGFSLFVAASRLIIAAVIILPTRKNLQLSQIQLSKSDSGVYYAIAAGICLAAHFATWTTSLAFTSIAASTVLVTTNPIWVGLFSWWWYREKLSYKGVIAILMALVGGVVIALANGNGDVSYANPILGNSLALIGAIMSSLYIIFGSQAQQRGLNTGNYVAIAYSTAAICLLPLPLLYDTSYLGYPPSVYVYVFLMAIMSQVIGHTSLNWSVRWISATLISLSLLMEPVVASFLGAIIFNEIPSGKVLLGSVIILGAIALFLNSEPV